MHRIFSCALLLVACGSTDLEPLPTDRDGGLSRDGGAIVVDGGDAGIVASDGGLDRDGGVDRDGGPRGDGGTPTRITLGGDRPAPLHVPADYDGAPLPLVVLLHGYTVTGEIQDSYFGLSARVDEERFFAIVPTGTRETQGQRATFWNATPACCNFYGSTVDDVGYLDGLVAEARTHVSVDPDRIYFVGHSNGGFMAYRMACEATTNIAAVISLAGATYFDSSDCVAPKTLHVLQIHGTLDTTIAYGGAAAGPMRYPGAVETVTRWATRAGCGVDFDDGPARDLDSALIGDETTTRVYRDGCSTENELWTIEGGGHIPALKPDFATQLLAWMRQHPRP